MQGQSRRLRRTPNACVACRLSKIKCSGEEPCANCRRRLIRCRFEEGGNKVVVSERYLQELQRQANVLQGSPRSSHSSAAPSAPAGEAREAGGGGSIPQAGGPVTLRTVDDARDIWTSPFSKPSTTVKGTYKNKRNWTWLAPSSMWSFTARLTLLISEKLNLEYSAPSFFGEDIYPLTWSPVATDCVPDTAGLPSIDHAFYLLETVKFNLGHNYKFFDEGEFVKHMREFYFGDAAKKASESRLWFVQFLLVLGFGKAFLSQPRNSRDPPAADLFIRAMSLMPEITSMWKDSVLAIEVLALAGLFLYCIDYRESAHVYVGQAIRIAQLEGLHTQLPEDELGAEVVARCRNLWWTLYIIDRHFSSSLGLPMSTPDLDITALIDTTSASPQRDSLLGLQVRLSRQLSFILRTIYETEQTQLGAFLETTRSMLQSMVGIAQEMERIFHDNFRSSIDAMSKETRHITLLYHQCVIVATRPLLLSVLKERLEKLNQGEEDWQGFLALTKPLISTGIKSAIKTLQVLSSEDGLLQLFLPFDLEFTYGAAIHVAMANVLFPHLDDCHAYGQRAHSLLDEMAFKGNRVAEMRKSELIHLETLFDELARRAECVGLQTLGLTTPQEPDAQARGGPAGEAGQDRGYFPQVEPAAMPTPTDTELSSAHLHPGMVNNEFLDNVGISSYDFLSIVDQMGEPDNYYSAMDDVAH